MAAWNGEDDIDDPQRRYPTITGVYKLFFDGQATVAKSSAGRFGGGFIINNIQYDATRNRTTADITITDNAGWIALEFKNTNGLVKNIKK